MQTPWGCPVCHESFCKTHPEAEQKTPHVWCGAGRGGHWVAVSSLPAIEKANARWIAHLDRRLAYERTLLEAEGKTDLLKPKARPKPPPLLNYRSAEPLQAENLWNRGQVLSYRQIEATKAQLARVPRDYKGTRLALDGSHRFRIAYARYFEKAEAGAYVAVFLTDSKSHPRPESNREEVAA